MRVVGAEALQVIVEVRQVDELQSRLVPLEYLACASGDPLRGTDIGARSPEVEQGEITEFVLQGRFRAAIDVFPDEPVPADHPIRGAENAVLSAHRAGALPRALHEIGRMVVHDLGTIFAGATPHAMQYATPELIAQMREEPTP